MDQKYQKNAYSSREYHAVIEEANEIFPCKDLRRKRLPREPPVHEAWTTEGGRRQSFSRHLNGCRFGEGWNLEFIE